MKTGDEQESDFPAGAGQPPDDCPIREASELMARLSSDFTRTLRQLRREMRHCTRCKSSKDCPILSYFNQQVQTAIDQINDEWNQLTTINP